MNTTTATTTATATSTAGRALRAATLVGAVMAATFTVTGCASLNPQEPIYSASQVQRADYVQTARVESVRPVLIDNSSQASSLFGTIGGGLLGAVAGSAIGHGHGSLLAGVAGGLGGALAGNAIQSHVERTQGLEITVRTPDGRMQSITQPASAGQFYPGQPVRLISGYDGTTRVAV
ncbi:MULTISPECIES: glycine zipper 2TM domain-containing protein [unclassified Cupriavidus]